MDNVYLPKCKLCIDFHLIRVNDNLQKQNNLPHLINLFFSKTEFYGKFNIFNKNYNTVHNCLNNALFETYIANKVLLLFLKEQYFVQNWIFNTRNSKIVYSYG